VGEDKIAAAIQELQKVAKAHPELGAVHWEIGELLAAGRPAGRGLVTALQRPTRRGPNSLPWLWH
jgi:hypothetical protein